MQLQGTFKKKVDASKLAAKGNRLDDNHKYTVIKTARGTYGVYKEDRKTVIRYKK